VTFHVVPHRHLSKLCKLSGNNEEKLTIPSRFVEVLPTLSQPVSDKVAPSNPLFSMGTQIGRTNPNKHIYRLLSTTHHTFVTFFERHFVLQSYQRDVVVLVGVVRLVVLVGSAAIHRNHQRTQAHIS
jgi:hypothetical protein